ncbi:iron ABC transporter permease [filamentous cyanobacterium LEGE 11480]|uniref:Iron ABC transporter permease n=1 Tax=Romeriopsis navalis LEGE 11480 TaxID=2777977 RepID=A0A928Z3G0_9CYAN|nr:iron ABC transporter permease [Romeriopsis navalis]MBE9029163.1 iron ABC transporter permease [Romeriopsis navalis LEGE 11480]
MQFSVSRGRSSLNRFRHTWTIASVMIAALVSLPLLAVLSGVFTDTRDVWQHLIQTVLGQYISNSLLLMLGVGIGVSVVGTVTAWLVTMCQFPGVRIFQWALLLPLAAPAYILAYSYTELLEYYGWVQTTLRAVFGWQSARDYWFPNVRSLWGAIVMFVLVLYPYVYLLARSAFLNQSSTTLEASRGLGCTPWQGFYKVALPLARPAIVAGVSLALMETLNDYGTVDFFAVPTFTIGIFRTWFAQGERLAATQLAVLLLGFIATLVLLERWSRKHQRYYQNTTVTASTPRYQLAGWHRFGALGACILPIFLGFFVPSGLLISLLFPGEVGDEDYASAGTGDFWLNSLGGDRFWSFATNSLTLAAAAAGLAVLVSVILAYSKRLQPTRVNQTATQLATLGYAIPGAVIAVGAMAPLGRFDNAVDAWMRSSFGISTGLLLSGTIVALLFAYLVRFLAVAFGAVSSSLENIKPNLDDASRSLGYRPGATLVKIHLPLIRGGLISAAILVFVDVMKELPATLIMHPPNFTTLAMRVYSLASDERLAEAALPALTIVLVGLLPVVLLSWQMGRGLKRSGQSD